MTTLCMCTGEDEMGLELLDGMEECVCPGQSLTYECTVMGELGGMTVWRGSVFDTSCTNREISLFRKNFDSTDGIFGECGEIVGRIVRDNIKFNGNNSVGYFVSQVSVPVSSNTSGKNIECQYDDGNTVLPVGDMIILAETGDKYLLQLQWLIISTYCRCSGTTK